MRTRIVGASLVLASMIATFVLRALVMLPPINHPATTIELVLAGFIVLAGLPGLGMLVEGPAIFGLTDRPRR